MGWRLASKLAAALTVLACGCSLLVDVNGLNGGDAPAPDAGGGSDAGRDVVTPSGDAGIGAPKDANAEAEAGPETPCGGSGDCIVFVTSSATNGAIGGISGGDAICAARSQSASATARVRGRKYFAWLSADADSPGARFNHATIPYKRPDGTTVAGDWNELTSGALRSGINVDETGSPIPGNDRVWTGTGPSGAALGESCGGWNTTSGSGRTGRAQLVDNGWTQQQLDGCGVNARIYCFEQ
jgi:hypothetical protein